MGVGGQVGHRVGGEGDVVAVFVGGAGGRLDADAGRDTGQHDLGDAAAAQVDVEVGAVERAPVPLGDDDVLGMPGQLVDDLVGIGGRRTGPALQLGAAGQAIGAVGGEADPDQDHGKVVLPERIGELRRPVDHVRGRVRLAGKDGDAVLQVDDDEGGLGVDGGDGHSEPLSWVVDDRSGGRLEGVVEESKGFEDGLPFGFGALVLQCLGQPLLPDLPVTLEPVPPGGGQRDDLPAAVLRVGMALDQVGLAQGGEDRGHRLWAHPLGRRQLTRRRRTVLVQPAEHGRLRRGQVVLVRELLQPALDAAEDHPHLAGSLHRRRRDRCTHMNSIN